MSLWVYLGCISVPFVVWFVFYTIECKNLAKKLEAKKTKDPDEQNSSNPKR